MGSGPNSGFDPYAVYAGDNAVNPNVPRESISTETVRSLLASLLLKNGFSMAGNLVRQSIAQPSKDHQDQGMVDSSSSARPIRATLNKYIGNPIPTLQAFSSRDSDRDLFVEHNHISSNMW